MPRIALFLLLFAVLFGAPAQAATVRLIEISVPDDDELFDREDDSYEYSLLRFRAAPGELNRLTVRRASRGRIIFRDARARVRRVGPGCRPRGRRAVTCERGENLHRIEVRLGDRRDRLSVSSRLRTIVNGRGGPGADRLTAGGGRAVFSGGSGDDRLTGGLGRDDLSGGPGLDRLLGGRGNDHLAGGTGRDRLVAGRGNDTLRPADGTRDSLDGGSGRDLADYSGFKAGLTLTPRGGGTGGEHDVFRAVESLAGGAADDVLTGDDAANRMSGGGGHDRIDARGGDDVIDVRGSILEGSLDATCGEGADRVLSYSGNDRVLIRGDCEALAYPSSGLQFDPRASAPSGRTVQMSLPCATPGDTAASRAVTVRTPPAGRRWFETGPYEAEVATGTLAQGTAGQNCTTTVELNDVGAELLSQSQLPVVVRVGARWFTPVALVLPAS